MPSPQELGYQESVVMGATEWLEREEALLQPTEGEKGVKGRDNSGKTLSSSESARDVALCLALALHQRSDAALADGRVLAACDDMEAALEVMKRWVCRGKCVLTIGLDLHIFQKHTSLLLIAYGA